MNPPAKYKITAYDRERPSRIVRREVVIEEREASGRVISKKTSNKNLTVVVEGSVEAAELIKQWRGEGHLVRVTPPSGSSMGQEAQSALFDELIDLQPRPRVRS